MIGGEPFGTTAAQKAGGRTGVGRPTRRIRLLTRPALFSVQMLSAPLHELSAGTGDDAVGARPPRAEVLRPRRRRRPGGGREHRGDARTRDDHHAVKPGPATRA